MKATTEGHWDADDVVYDLGYPTKDGLNYTKFKNLITMNNKYFFSNKVTKDEAKFCTWSEALETMHEWPVNGNPRLVITDKPVTFHEMASKCFELDIFTNGHADFDKLGIDTGSVASRSEKQNSCNDPQVMIQKVF